VAFALERRTVEEELQEESGETMSIWLAFRGFGFKANKLVLAKPLKDEVSKLVAVALPISQASHC
jgi:hypothetical protein